MRYDPFRPDSGFLLESDMDYLWHPFTPVRCPSERLFIVRGEGSHVWDLRGKRYLDAKSASLHASIGYGNQEVIESICNQMKVLMNFDLMGFTNPPAAHLASVLASILPGELSKSFFCLSGSEAMEAALKMAFSFQAARGESARSTVVGVNDGYHGATLGALSITSIAGTGFGYPKLDCPVHLIPRPSPTTAVSLADIFGHLDPTTVVAMVLEPLQGVAGIHLMPDLFLQQAATFCKENGIVLIFDEVFTGFGRTGKMFACEYSGAIPDILTASKGITGGYVPLSTISVTDSFYQTFADDPVMGGFRHGHTNSGHATACACALAVINIIRRDGLVENAATLGRHLLASLRSALPSDCIVEVRGLGLAIGVEFGTSMQADAVNSACRERGLILRYVPGTHVLAIVPPLILVREEADFIIAVIIDSIKQSISEGKN